MDNPSLINHPENGSQAPARPRNQEGRIGEVQQQVDDVKIVIRFGIIFFFILYCYFRSCREM